MARPLAGPEIVISTARTSIATRLAAPSTPWPARLYQRLQLTYRRQIARHHKLRFALLASNVIILAIIVGVVVLNHTDSQTAAAVPVPTGGSAAAVANPLDQVSSADIALTVARVDSLPETTAITNQAQSQAADVAVAATDNSVTTKPEVVTTALKSRADIQTYTVQAGDTIPALAAKFGITSDSIRWSNNLTGDTVPTGTKLLIPPVNGIVYTVKAGDTADSLAARYGSSKDQILAYNDAEINGLQVGEQIIIPNVTQNAAAAGTPVPTASNPTNAVFPWGNGPLYGYNGYDFGYCTWYVATQIPVPANWGNASTWAYYARLSGWNVSTTPTVGAIAQKGGGEGHVAIVTAVNPDGSVTVRDMNGFAGWDRVGTGTVSAGFFQNFITH
ncbi:MAG TPA: LysM peptidoglycan-binding domain-containing protein [Candidatus Saccharimonadales bacterium]|nr:LysM peptidoglycan-binding domain-containing protein [Candidatus Saccharimonadales bacterium]